MLIKNIRWDTDGDMEALASLPTEVYTPPFLHQEQYDDIEEFLDDVSVGLALGRIWMVPFRIRDGNR